MAGLSLVELIEQTGMKKVAIAEELGISRVSLYRKLVGNTAFTEDELVKLTGILERSLPRIIRRLVPMPVRK